MIFFDNKSLAKGNVFVRPRSALSYSDTKSYQNLLVNVYGGRFIAWLSGTNVDTAAQHAPTVFIENGFYYESKASGLSLRCLVR